MAVVVAALLLSGAYLLLAAPRPLPAILPWLAVMIAYLSNTTRTLRKFRRPNRFITLAHAIVAGIVRLVVGRPTWEAMQRSGQRIPKPPQAIRSHPWN